MSTPAPPPSYPATAAALAARIAALPGIAIAADGFRPMVDYLAAELQRLTAPTTERDRLNAAWAQITGYVAARLPDQYDLRIQIAWDTSLVLIEDSDGELIEPVGRPKDVSAIEYAVQIAREHEEDGDTDIHEDEEEDIPY